MLTGNPPQKIDTYSAGEKDRDEYTVFVRSDDKSLQVSFINVAYMSGYSDILPKLSPSDIIQATNKSPENPYAGVFLEAVRESNGICFIHNSQPHVPVEYDFSIHVEKPLGHHTATESWERKVVIEGTAASKLFRDRKFQDQLLHMQSNR